MKRRLFNIVAAVSLLLCVATVGMWIDSYFNEVALRWSFNLGTAVVGYSRGQIAAVFTTLKAPGSGLYVDRPESLDSNTNLGLRFQLLGFAWMWNPFHGALIPCWLIVLLTAIAPFLWLRKPPTPPGMCAFCGYDLRATPDRCPECGRTPKTKPHT